MVDERAILAAGLIMGEGCISLKKSNVKDFRTGKLLKNRIGMCVSIVMGDSEVVDWFHKHWGGWRSKKARGDKMHSWVISSNPALKFLEEIEPYVFGEKKEQLKLAIEFQKGRIPNKRSSERLDYELEAFKVMRDLKPRNKGRYETA